MNAMTPVVTCIPVPKGAVHHIWDEIAPMLEKAVRTARGKSTIDDIRRDIDADIYLLWIVMIEDKIVAAITTRIINYPQCRAMSMDWIGGRRMKDWIGIANEAMVTHARHNGCTHMEGYGRLAWLRWLERYGWEIDYTAFRMEI